MAQPEPQQPPVPGQLDTPQKLQSYLNSCPPGLTKLDLTNLHISSLAGVIFPPGMTSLNLYTNQISSLEGVQFTPGLTELGLSYNRIASLEGVQFPPGLISLDLSSNRIASLEGVHFPPGLTRLYLYTNQISSLDGVQFPSTLTYLYLADNRITTLQGVQFPRGLTNFNCQDNPLISLAGMINPNTNVKNCFMNYYNSLYLRDIEGEKAARQSQKAELNELSQQSMRNQLNAVTSFLREGMETRAREHNEKVGQGNAERGRPTIFVKIGIDTYYVPFTHTMTVQDVLDYLNTNYYISMLIPNHSVMRLSFNSKELDSSQMLVDRQIQNESTLYAVGKIIHGGRKRPSNKSKKCSQKRRNKSKKN